MKNHKPSNNKTLKQIINPGKLNPSPLPRINTVLTAPLLIALLMILAGCQPAASDTELTAPPAADQSEYKTLQSPSPAPTQTTKNSDISAELADSLIYLDVSTYLYDQIRPWRQPDTVQDAAFAIAVDHHSVLTTAWAVADAALIKARRYAKNEFIPVKIKVIDYQANLCLLELNPEYLDKPLKPVKFDEIFPKGKPVSSYWLSAGGHINNARAYLDKAEMHHSNISYNDILNFTISSASQTHGIGETYFHNKKAIGICCWNSDTDKTARIIPAESINRFLAEAAKPNYKGFGTADFSVATLIDPTVRNYLGMDPGIKHGTYVSDVGNLATGSKTLQQGDVILSINGNTINPYGRFNHKVFERLNLQYIINSSPIGSSLDCTIWRDNENKKIKLPVKKALSEDMLVPAYLFDKKPQYIVTGGYVFQHLTLNYLQYFGKDWQGKVPPHLYHYYRNKAFKPDEQREKIVILSYVLPADINMGYQKLRMLVVDTVNDRKIKNLEDMADALNHYSEDGYIKIEFEQSSPTLVIDTDLLNQSNYIVSTLYGIQNLQRISN